MLDVTDADLEDIGRGTLVNDYWASGAPAGRDTGRCLDCRVCGPRTGTGRCAGRLLLARNRASFTSS